MVYHKYLTFRNLHEKRHPCDEEVYMRSNAYSGEICEIRRANHRRLVREYSETMAVSASGRSGSDLVPRQDRVDPLVSTG
jgi:hemerythrin